VYCGLEESQKCENMAQLPCGKRADCLGLSVIVVDLTVVVLDGRRWESRVAFAGDRAGTSPS